MLLQSKKRVLNALNQSLHIIIFKAIEDTVAEGNNDKCAELIQLAIPEATDIELSPISFKVKAIEGSIKIRYFNGNFIEV